MKRMKHEDEAHSPSPWQVAPNDERSILDRNGRLVASAYAAIHQDNIIDEQRKGRDRAAMIVRDHNNYTALLEAAKFALTTSGLIKGRDRLEVAVALAEKDQPS